MSLRDYLVARDRFEFDAAGYYGFPCNVCRHVTCGADIEPCRTCDHNENAVRAEEVKVCNEKARLVDAER